jgi:hypothetical protein
MRCIQCNQEIGDGDTIVPVSPDGDMVCGLICKVRFEKERERFFAEIVHDDEKFEEWMSDLD